MKLYSTGKALTLPAAGLLSGVPEKKQCPNPLIEKKEIQPIRLKSFTSDYGTFVRTTRKALGMAEAPLSKDRLSRQFALLVNLES